MSNFYNKRVEKAERCEKLQTRVLELMHENSSIKEKIVYYQLALEMIKYTKEDNRKLEKKIKDLQKENEELRNTISDFIEKFENGKKAKNGFE